MYLTVKWEDEPIEDAFEVSIACWNHKHSCEYGAVTPYPDRSARFDPMSNILRIPHNWQWIG